MSDEMLHAIDDGDEWIDEEIDPQEVEIVVSALAELIDNVESETVGELLKTACDDISSLVDWEEEEEDEAPPRAEAA